MACCLFVAFMAWTIYEQYMINMDMDNMLRPCFDGVLLREAYPTAALWTSFGALLRQVHRGLDLSDRFGSQMAPIPQHDPRD